MVGYFVGAGQYIVPLVVYLVYKDKSKFVAFHALQSLFFQLALLVIYTILVILALTVILACLSVPVGIIISIGALVYVIYAGIQAYNGQLFEYWLVGKWARDCVGI
ncbi:MAG TPA: DUF4870 domain-containing protein [Armatimonadetes bacterium]|nr:DUF4870 domain-containing protein [Armatimonadota bacterium]